MEAEHIAERVVVGVFVAVVDLPPSGQQRVGMLHPYQMANVDAKSLAATPDIHSRVAVSHPATLVDPLSE